MLEPTVFFPVVGAVLVICIGLLAWSCNEYAISLFFFAIGGYWLWCAHDNTTPETKAVKAAEEKARKDERVRQETPHVVREADGCKVYAFKSRDRWHYFTRCPNATTVTDTAYEECTGSGKNRTCKELHSSIENEVMK